MKAMIYQWLLQYLRENHDQFKASLSAAQADFNQLAALDKQIQGFQVGTNPYTWFTMEALEDTWKNLQRIIKVRTLNAILCMHFRYEWRKNNILLY